MKFKKHKLADSKLGYFITCLHILGQERIIAAPEGQGPALVFSLPTFEPQVLASEPGGCMGFASIPGRDDAILMITEFYPIFKSENAGIHLFKAVHGLDTPWLGKRIIDLPFVHRIAMVDNGLNHFLVAATVCGGKDFQDDWSKPGAVYVAMVPGDLDGTWELQVIMENIHKNHGMKVGVYGGKRCVYISGTEGLFALEVPHPGSSDWKIKPVLPHEISEVFPADLDGDGKDELAVIEPFHGNAMSVYKNIKGNWNKIYSAELAFGHGLWAGSLAGENVVIAGNRDGNKDLACFRVVSTDPFAMDESVVDEASGTTNMDVIRTPQGAALVTSNPGYEEYALYFAVNE